MTRHTRRIAVLRDGTEGDIIRTFRKSRHIPNDETTYLLRLDEVKGDRPTGLEREVYVSESDIQSFHQAKKETR